ncbi:MAG: hypothetical protein AB7X49_00380 [Geminicoccaceae bacterium]
MNQSRSVSLVESVAHAGVAYYIAVTVHLIAFANRGAPLLLQLMLLLASALLLVAGFYFVRRLFEELREMPTEPNQSSSEID